MDTGDRTSYNLRVRLVSERVYKTNRRGKILFYSTAWPVKKASLKFECFSALQIKSISSVKDFGLAPLFMISKVPYSLTLNFLKTTSRQFNDLAVLELPPCFLCFRAMPLLNFLKPCPYHQQELCRQWQELLLVLH